MELEKIREQIEYYRVNLHEKVDNIDAYMKTEALGSKHVTYCLIAKKYYWYGDRLKSADYFYKDWGDQAELLRSTTGPIPWDCGHSDGNSLTGAMSLWEETYDYPKFIAHFQELYDHTIKSFGTFSKVSLIKSNFAEYKKNWPMEANHYTQMMQRLNQAKKLAKTTKPKPLAPAVQNHEWFYSDKQEEVLKALEYYHKHTVRFMLEKALKHKSPGIAAKAKEYLDNPVKEK